MREGTNADKSLQSLAAAAHELKTPLAVISHMAAALEDESFGTGEQRQESLQRIQLLAERTMRLVQSLTDSYKLSADQLQLQLQPVNLGHVCEEVVHEMTTFAAMQHQTMQLDLGSRSQIVVGNRELLHSILFNLLDNAIRHTPPETTVRMRVSRQVDMARVAVHDNGPGLRESDIARLSERLGRHIQPITTRSSGSGLGLYIAQQLAMAMGGAIGVGRARVGADFHVDLLRSKQLNLL